MAPDQGQEEEVDPALWRGPSEVEANRARVTVEEERDASHWLATEGEQMGNKIKFFGCWKINMNGEKKVPDQGLLVIKLNQKYNISV
jgi:hypothetical protein